MIPPSPAKPSIILHDNYRVDRIIVGRRQTTICHLFVFDTKINLIMSQLWPQVEMDELVAVLKKEDNGHYWSSGQDERNDATLVHLWRHQICDW